MTPCPSLAHRWIRPEIQALSAYQVADPGKLIKLDAMENPYRWPSDLVEQWMDRLRALELNRYPDPTARDLSEKLKQVMHVP